MLSIYFLPPSLSGIVSYKGKLQLFLRTVLNEPLLAYVLNVNLPLHLTVCLQYKEKRLEQEKELLQGQVTWLSEELKTKSEELLSLSREKGSEILELRCSLNNKEDEV